MIPLKLNFQALRSKKHCNDGLLSYPTKTKTNPERFTIIEFMEFASQEVSPSSDVLDAGAGSRPYQNYFSHTNYESTDRREIPDSSAPGKHSFLCNLEEIPRPDNSYDAIVNTQVLEHVEYPQTVINEFYRVLKPHGKLFLTAPQGWGLHQEPYHFFNFTKYGLESLFKNARFEIIFIRPRGGIFWYLANRISILPDYVVFSNNALTRVFRLLLSPVCRVCIPLLFFHLDRLDTKKDFTLGYACYCIKGCGEE